MIFASRTIPRIRAHRALLPLALGLAAAACSSPESGDTSGTGGAAVNPADTFSIDTATYTVEPGQEVRYLCYTTHLPADKALTATKIAPVYGKAVHHLAIYSTLVPEPEGVFDCPQLEKPTWIPIYVGGVESGSITAPAGAGFHLTENEQILVQLHLLNAGAETVKDKASIVFTTSDDTSLIGAGMFGMSDNVIDLPPHSSGVQATMSCPVGRDMDVFAVFAHMHQHGTVFDASRGAVAGQSVLFHANWNFNDQPTTPLAFHLSASDQITERCTYDNPGSTDVTYGESSYQEMCAFVVYYTPFTSVDGCLKTTGPQ